LESIFVGDAENKGLQAQQIALVFDSCHSGKVLEGEEWRVGPMNSRGLAQLAWEKGMEILTASQSDEFAMENNRLGHGILTYCLLEGFDKAPYEDNKLYSDVWLEYAANEVHNVFEGGGMKNEKGVVIPYEYYNEGNTFINVQTPNIFSKREGGIKWPVASK